MPRLDGRIGEHGCIVPIALRPADDEAILAGAPRRNIVFQALVDTGADVSCITPAVANELRMEAHEIDAVRAPGAPDGFLCFLYRVDVSLLFANPDGPHPTRILISEALLVYEMHLPDTFHQAILGRDLLEHLALRYDGPVGTFSLELPDNS